MNLKKLESLREKFNWEIEEERRKFLNELYPLTRQWKGLRPILRKIFRRDEIDWLLAESVSYKCGHKNLKSGERFVYFVINTGYKDEPKLDEDGKPLLRHTTPLHCAAGNKYRYLIRDLFEIYDRFDVNYVDEFGVTHFHIACEYGCDEVVKKFLEFGQDPNCLTQESSSIDPPLHLALKQEHQEIFKLLLRSGADPNLTNKDGSTPLHFICKGHEMRYRDDVFAEILFEIDEDDKYRRHPVQVDARDKLGQTPLHVALFRNSRDLIELLLNNGANPNLANSEGLTPLHIICQHEYNCDLAKMLFDISEKKHQLVHVDARDKFGRTPLHLSVVNLYPDFVEIFLDHGADAPSFTFPTKDQFAESLSLQSCLHTSKLDLVFRTLAIIDHLGKRGYELDRSDALTIMKIFDEYKLFEQMVDRKKLRSSDELKSQSKKFMMNSNLSLYEFIWMRPKAVTKLFTVTDFLPFVRAKKHWNFPGWYKGACENYLSNIMAEGFLRRWALEFFWALTGYRVPFLCCEKVINQLRVEDLWRICLATEDKSMAAIRGFKNLCIK
ncbi:alpha-latrotoxin-Lh1a-like isoform X2 [Trichogramma pretiosum]|nr:alpha-latrotoxin-Lh1a-like isoform X2 [Trichogramma pretiosum]